MMALTRERVQYIAELAKLELTDKEIARYGEQLSAVLDYAARLQAIDTDDISPTASVLPVNTVLRDDEVRPSMPREDILENAASKQDGLFRVNVILEEE